MKRKRTKAQIQGDIQYESAPGVHTYHLCKCGQMAARGARCIICLTEELRAIERKEAHHGRLA